MPDPKELRAEIVPAFKIYQSYLAVAATGVTGLPPIGVYYASGTLDARCYLSVAELREFCRGGLEIADAIEAEKPAAPSETELAKAFGPAFVNKTIPGRP